MTLKLTITCDVCKKEFESDGRPWEITHPTHQLKIGYETHPSGWCSSGSDYSPPPITFHGITIPDACNECYLKIMEGVKKVIYNLEVA